MKKKKVLLVVGIGLLTVGILSYIGYKGFDRQAWLVYSNSRYGFKVEFPPAWELGPQETNNAGREMISEDEDALCYAYGFENALDQTLDEFADWLTSENEVLKKNQTKFAGNDAVEIVSRIPTGKVQYGVYAFLDDNSGRGLLCTFASEAVLNTYSDITARMKKSFKLVEEDITFTNMHTACATLLAGSITPLKDLQTFLDEEYTEVTITSRDAWNQTKLPAQVKSLEGQGYTCYPMPYKMEPAEQEPGMHVVPAVDTVEWQCELEHTDYKYVEKSDSETVTNLSTQGYSCQKEFCTDALDNESFAWLCTK